MFQYLVKHFLTYIACKLMLLFQGPLVKSYPAELRLTFVQCLCSAMQTAVIAVIFERSPSSWKLKLNIPLLAAVYCVSSLHSQNHIYIYI